MRDRKNDNAHRDTAAIKLGRKLTSSDIVDHANEDKSDNNPANLSVTTRSGHGARHGADRKSGLSALRKSLRMVKEGKRSY
jgi:hypothetical protein